MGSLGYLSLLGGDYKRTTPPNIVTTPPGLEENDQDTEAGFKETVTPPKDDRNFVYYGLILAGIGFLLPYNSFVAAVDYFQDKYPGSTIVFDISTVYIFSALGAVFLNNFLVNIFSLNSRICFGYSVSFITLTLVAVFEVWLQTMSDNVAYTFTLIAIALLSIGCTVQQSSFYGYSSMLPHKYTQAVMTGESAAGLLVSLNRILTKDLIEDQRVNTIFFFIVSILVVVLCYFTHKKVQDTDFVSHYIFMCKSRRNNIQLHETDDQVDLIDDPNHFRPIIRNQNQENREGAHGVADNADLPQFGQSCNLNPTIGDRITEAFIGFRGMATANRGSILDKICAGLKSRFKIAKEISSFMVAICLAYFTTLCLFPGIESEIVSCSLGSWMPVLLMATFNACDLAGKISASYLMGRFTSQGLVMGSVLRLFLIPLMLMCASPRTQPIISEELPAFCIVGLLGVSNGIFGSIPMILGPGSVKENQKELAGNIMTISYSFGLTLGSITAYFFDNSLGEPNPSICHDDFVNVTTKTFP